MHYMRIMSRMHRRHFLGWATLGGAGVLVRPGFAQAAAPDAIRPAVLAKAMAALNQHGARIAHRDIVGIVDFSSASSAPRLHLLNMTSGVATRFLVAHGRGSDPAHTGWVQRFSNTPGSEASSNGAYLTGETYTGHHGMSRRLLGLDPGNDQAESRAIVIHAAWYVSESAAQAQGRIGRSEGCFAVSEADIAAVLTMLGPGRLLFADKA